ncbi:Extracellular metalloproteinase MEP [Rhizoctonia solani AG-1 IB]|uniref:Extracellular metalloproteinase n=1 Tax=Thanatephorus cucumeris (strain AG1-IB / isolate 7/3/14) TaxID=1108050 RepID=M5C7Z6_THACB|nr:Extracellular metalloproteinase MEP [Rhizoctonia solani AG-1 IB]
MTSVTKLAAVALMTVSGTVAAPWYHPLETSSTTHYTRALGPNNIKVHSFHPPSTFKTYGTTGVNHPLSKRDIKASSSETAKSFLESETGIHSDEIVHRTGHSSDAKIIDEHHQNGIKVANAVANVALKDNKVISYGVNFVKSKAVAPFTPTFPQKEAIKNAESVTGAKYNSHPVELEYIITDSSSAVLTYTIEVRNEDTLEWYHVHVDASNGEVLSVVDFVSSATAYRVTPFTSQDLTDTGFSLVTDPFDKVASPNGAYIAGNAGYETTSQSSPTNIYDYVRKPNLSVSEGPNPDAARVNVFYIANMMHDLTYRYGFTEKTWNFQQDNRGLGGAENDRIEIRVHGNTIGVISVLADGRPGTMELGLWSQGDGAFQNDVTLHEYTHGVVGRLTGGGTAKCFQTTEAFGLNEGWADAVPNLIQRSSAEDRDFVYAKWANGRNLRTYPYSTNKTIHPRMYGDSGTKSDLLAIAELWAVIWHEITVALMKEHGFAANLFDPTLTNGNTITLHLIIDGLIAQPCNPTFIDARNAVIQADANRYNGANKCTLWKAFAKRGLGYGATTTKVNSETLPPEC